MICELSWLEPDDAFRRVRHEPVLVWLDSSDAVGSRSRYSYLCIDPFSVLELRGGMLRQDDVPLDADPFAALAAFLAPWQVDRVSAPVPFQGGAVGLLGYGLSRRLERLTHRHAENPDLPELWFGLFDLLLAFDRAERRCWIISRGLPEPTAASRALHAQARADWLQDRLCHNPSAATGRLPPLEWHPDLSLTAYTSMIRRGLELIHAGDIFQANLTMRHVATRPPALDPTAVHLALRRANPAPFSAYIGWGRGQGLSSTSPERFIRLDNAGGIETRPIKGTRARHSDPVQDDSTRAELAVSVKDHAENLMIVDLMRNDLSRVAAAGSVRVPELCRTESFATVHHLVSSITAKLGPGADAIDLLRATFPGGSVTGAPKIRAMEVIDTLEVAARGPYCGCIAWLGFDGAMDSSIVIRTLLITGRQVIAQAGGGIVADSVPEAEHAEMMTKVAPLLSVFPGTVSSA
ncbi:MAG: anthranilate synthase component I family protein [Janthinobacterium lividum]